MKLSLSDSVLAEIGKIVVIHGLIDSALAGIVGTIVSLNRAHQLGQIVTAELSFRQRIGMLRSLLVFVFPDSHEVIADFDRIRKLLYAADDERNRIAHSVWAHPDGDSDPHCSVRIKTTAKEKRGLQVEFVRVEIDDLRKSALIVGEAYAQLSLFDLRFCKDDEQK